MSFPGNCCHWNDKCTYLNIETEKLNINNANHHVIFASHHLLSFYKHLSLTIKIKKIMTFVDYFDSNAIRKAFFYLFRGECIYLRFKQLPILTENSRNKHWLLEDDCWPINALLSVGTSDKEMYALKS